MIDTGWGENANPGTGLVSVVDSTSVSKLADFTSYSNQIKSATPTGTNKASYTPTNSELQACPTVGGDWRAKASPLPPTPDSALCSCVYDAAACVPDSGLSNKKLGSLLSTVCGLTDCSGLSSNATTGVFGAYKMCSTKEQLAFALNKYYTEQSKAASACSFSGSASTKATTQATGACSAQITEAGTAGTGTVTTEPTATAGSGSSSSSSSGSAGVGKVYSSATFGSFQVGASVLAAFLAGMGMVLL